MVSCRLGRLKRFVVNKAVHTASCLYGMEILGTERFISKGFELGTAESVYSALKLREERYFRQIFPCLSMITIIPRLSLVSILKSQT